MPKQKWCDIDNKDVRHIYECECCSKKVKVGPASFMECGQPLCMPCDTEMVYVKTQVRIKEVV